MTKEEDDEIEEFSEALNKRIAVLEEINERLIDEARENEGEKRYIQNG